MRRVWRGSLSTELLVCGGGVRSILLLPLVARCLETIDVMDVFSVCGGLPKSVCVVSVIPMSV